MAATEKGMNFIRVSNLPQFVFSHLAVQCRRVYFLQPSCLFTMSIAYLQGFYDGFFLCILVFQW